MKLCKTCGLPLWLGWLLLGAPWKKRVRKYKDATDCIHILPLDQLEEIKNERTPQ